MRYWIPLALCLLLPAEAIAYTPQELESQLELLMEWWPGEYDNNEQIVRQSGGGLSTPVYAPHFRIHAHYVPLQLDSIGGHVLYVEEYKNNDPTELYRIRLLSLETDKTVNGLRLVLYRFFDQAAWQGGHIQIPGAWPALPPTMSFGSAKVATYSLAMKETGFAAA